MNGLGAIAVTALTGWTFLQPPVGSWAFTAAEFAFLSWLGRELRRVDAAAPLGSTLNTCASPPPATSVSVASTVSCVAAAIFSAWSFG